MIEKHNPVAPVCEMPAAWNELTSRIIGAAMEVHTRLGPVGLENLFQRAIVVELRHIGLNVREQARVPVLYRNVPIGEVVIDVLVNELVVVELKSVDEVIDVHFAQLSSYMRHGDFPIGLLINFRVAHLRNGIHRRVNSRSSRISNSLPSA